MNDATQENAERPVLLTWRISTVKRVVFVAMPVAIALTAASIAAYVSSSADVFVVRWLATMIAMLGAPVLVIAFRSFLQAAARVTVATHGLAVEPVLGRKVSISWENVTAVKRTLAGNAVLLLSTVPGIVYLRVPKDVLHQLISILREASDARIIGFD